MQGLCPNPWISTGAANNSVHSPVIPNPKTPPLRLENKESDVRSVSLNIQGTVGALRVQSGMENMTGSAEKPLRILRIRKLQFSSLNLIHGVESLRPRVSQHPKLSGLNFSKPVTICSTNVCWVSACSGSRISAPRRGILSQQVK